MNLSRHEDAARVFIQAGADLEATDCYGNTILINLASTQEFKLSKMLLNAGAFVNTRNLKGQTPLIAAIGYNNLKLVRWLIAFGASLDIVGEFKRESEPVSEPDSASKVHIILPLTLVLLELWTAFTSAYPILMKIHSLLRSELQLLVAVCTACALCFSPVLMLMLTPEKITPLLIAATSKYPQALQITRLLIQAGASLLATESDDKRKNALHLAAEHGQTEIVKRLIRCGLDAEVEDGTAATPLQLAGRHQNFGTALALLKSGVTMRSNNEATDDRARAQRLLLKHQDQTFAQDSTISELNQPDSVAIQEVYTLCRDIGKHFTTCSRLRDELKDARANKPFLLKRDNLGVICSVFSMIRQRCIRLLVF